MNINVQGLKLFNNFSSKAEQNRMERQQKRDNQIAFIENQKHNLKNIQSESIEDIKKKLQMIEDYDNQIAAVKAEYNHEQVFHMLDEAWETGEKIAEAAKKAAPKTPEERKEELIEEATGATKSDGLLADVMDDPTDIADEMEEMEGVIISEADLKCDDRMAAEQSEGAVQGKEFIEEIEENLEEMDENMESVESVEDIPEEDKLIAEEMEKDQSIDGKTLTEQQRMEELMMHRTEVNEDLLNKVGISVGANNKLEVDEDKLKSSDIKTLKTLFTGYNSFASKMSDKGRAITNAAARGGGTYNSQGRYSDALSSLLPRAVDKKE